METPVNDVSLSGNYAILDTSWGYVHSVDISDPTNPVDVSFNGQGGNPTIDVYTDDSNHAYACGPKFQRFIVEPNGALNGAGSFNFTSLCGSVFVENDTNAYVGYGSNLYILDLLAPGYLPWSITMVGGVGETVVRNNYAYIINRNYGLAVYDVSNVQSPSFVSSLDTPGFRPYDLEIAGDFAFVADGRYGLQIINIAHPQSPTLVGSYETFYGTYDAFIGDSYAYSPYGDDGVLVMALSDPANPILVGQYDTPGDSYDVWVDGDRAYVADTTGGLRIADVTTPTQPVELGFVDTIDAWRVTVAGDYAYVIEAIANEPYWLHVVDVSDPANPIINGSVEMSGILWEVAVSGNYVYLAAADAGLRVIDVSDPTVPVEVSYYPAPDVFDVQIRGTYAYLAAPDFNGGFLILDISDPTDPTLVVRYNPGGQYSFFHVAVSGNFAYLGDPIGAANVTVLDIADPANPIHLDEVVVPGDMFRLLADGKYLYVADGDAGLGVYRNSMISDYQATLGPNSVLQASPGTTVTHTFTLENLGLTDTYTFTVSGPTWQTSLLTPSPVTVLAGEAITIEVSVEVPADPGAPSDSFILSGASLNDPNLMLTATGTTMVLLPPEPTFEIYLPIILAP